ncbi:MAG TPA: DoxX family protein [Gammaproteobacteria bacterium]|nr:DoxX family protein [Gammaproteobacteria bacterium]
MAFLDSLAPFAHWALRIALASVFLYHGWGKMPPDQFAQGMGFPIVLGWLVALGELAAGVLLLLGGFLKDWMTRIGALLVIVIMIGAIVLVHWPNGWSVADGGMEFQVVMLLVGLYLLIKGNRVNAATA